MKVLITGTSQGIGKAIAELFLNSGHTVLGIDKQKAKHGKWRISEKTLIGAALLGGSIGAILGMNIFRHKTKHPKFSIGLPLILAVQIMLCVLFLMRFL